MPKIQFKKPCTKCKRLKPDYEFFKYKRTNPEGPEKWHDLCKDCMCRDIDNWDPNTFKWILKDFDVPYIESEWIKIRDRECDKVGDRGLTGKSIIGKYMMQMKLPQYAGYGYDDTDTFNASKLGSGAIEEAEMNNDAKIAEMEENYKNGEITKEEFEAFMRVYTSNPVEVEARYKENPGAATRGKKGSSEEEIGYISEPLHQDLDDEIVNYDDILSKEDKIYLLQKWGDQYTCNQWIALEQSYKDYIDNFAIEGIAREEQVKTICKTYLKMNEALDRQDLEAFSKLNKIYIDLQKAAKFNCGLCNTFPVITGVYNKKNKYVIC